MLSHSMAKIAINLGTWTEKEIDDLLGRTGRWRESSQRIVVLSERFLGTEYGESTLIGDVHNQEVLVVNFERVDCFTLIDYVEALRLSGSFEKFEENLVRVRYQHGELSYLRRNHFFTDWIDFNEKHVVDATIAVGGQAVARTVKTLNLREDGTFFLDGIAPRSREIRYIPGESVGIKVFAGLKTGDYAGIYSERAGLDVSHVGIIIKDSERVVLRHASSLQANRRVVDQDLKDYLADKPGLVILRPREAEVLRS